ncbi:hypothetical protein O181_110678, partial [Austropuccinia psidii MF-1]|nr:hypothetical protein [Austropuccinia psidii MF-1]
MHELDPTPPMHNLCSSSFLHLCTDWLPYHLLGISAIYHHQGESRVNRRRLTSRCTA